MVQEHALTSFLQDITSVTEVLAASSDDTAPQRNKNEKKAVTAASYLSDNVLWDNTSLFPEQFDHFVILLRSEKFPKIGIYSIVVQKHLFHLRFEEIKLNNLLRARLGTQ